MLFRSKHVRCTLFERGQEFLIFYFFFTVLITLEGMIAISFLLSFLLLFVLTKKKKKK